MREKLWTEWLETDEALFVLCWLQPQAQWLLLLRCACILYVNFSYISLHSPLHSSPQFFFAVCVCLSMVYSLSFSVSLYCFVSVTLLYAMVCICVYGSCWLALRYSPNTEQTQYMHMEWMDICLYVWVWEARAIDWNCVAAIAYTYTHPLYYIIYRKCSAFFEPQRDRIGYIKLNWLYIVYNSRVWLCRCTNKKKKKKE